MMFSKILVKIQRVLNQHIISISENAMISYLGRVNYIYDDKYYLTATFRRDGTSRLAK